MLALWSCGRRVGVVQAQRQIHRAFGYAAANALRHTRHADLPYPLAPPRKIGRNKSDEAVGVSFGQHSSYPGCLLPGFYFGSSLELVVALLSGLWLALASLALFEPIAVAVQFEDVDVVGQSVEQRTGQPLGPEHAGPLVEWQIAGDDGGAALIALAEDLEQELGAGRRKGYIAEFIDDQQLVTGQLAL